MTASPPSPVQGSAVSETSGKAIGALACALLGFALCPIVSQIIAILIARMALADIRASQGRLTGDAFAKAAIIIGCIGLTLYLLIASVFFLLTVFALMA